MRSVAMTAFCAALSADAVAQVDGVSDRAAGGAPCRVEDRLACVGSRLHEDSLLAPHRDDRRLDAEVPDGTMLWYRQSPPLIRADRRGGLLFDILIAGDFEEVAVERYSAGADRYVTERWPRADRRTLDGLVVSVFEPTWSHVELWDTLAWRRRGYDSPGSLFGRLRVQDRWVRLHVAISPVNLPPSAIERVDESVQYASHVVNIAVPEPHVLRNRAIIREFYEHFVDEYESIAIVLPGHGFGRRSSAYHVTVRNPIAGLGRAVFDGSADYGSRGTLRGFETYYDLAFTSMEVSNHELGHTWVDFWNWAAITGLDLGLCSDGVHYPPLFPGTSYLGKCLNPRSAIAEIGDGRFAVVGSSMPATFNPATLYRMGLVESEAVGEMVVFSYRGEQQPLIPRGHVFEGGYARVHINDVIARHGERSGPVDSSWRRAAIVVSRGELLSSEEMSYWNFFAARHAAEGGEDIRRNHVVPRGDRGPREAHTDVTPKAGMKIVSDLEVSEVPVDAREFRGVRLDEPIPASFEVGDSITPPGR